MFASQIFFFKIPSLFFKSHFSPVIWSIFFSCKYLSCFWPLRAQPKGGGTVTNHDVCVTCHAHHTSATDFRPKSGNPMEVTLMTSPKLHIVPTLRELTSLSFNINSCTKVHSSELDLVTGGQAYMLSPSLPLGESYLDYGGPGCNKTSQMARIG